LRPSLSSWNTASFARNHRAALWTTVAGAVLIGGVLAANLWSRWHAKPELVPLEPLDRLTALQASQAPSVLPKTAEASRSEPEGRADVRGTSERLVAPSAKAQPAASAETTRSWVVQPGESMAAALGRLFVVGPVQRDVIEAYASLKRPQQLQAGWRLWGRFQTSGVVDSGALSTLVIAPQHGEGITIERKGESFVARAGGLPGTVERQALRCGISGSLEASLLRCGETAALAQSVATILHDRMEPEVELAAGDELRLVVEKLLDGAELVRYLQVLAVEVRGVKGKRALAVHFDNGHGLAGYYSAEGESLEAMFMLRPLRSGSRTSGFGMRMHPILHKMKAHYGVDFAAARGTPIYAAADGVLTTAHRAGPAGNLVRLRHADGYVTEYMHLHKFADIAVGQNVHKGQVIGQVGSTGRSTGPHLHFGVRHHGNYLDPTKLGSVREPDVSGRDRKAFDAHAAEMLRLLDALGDRGPSS
jgi:hypothetical protein